MATAASLTLDVWRNDDVYEFPLRVRGPDLTGIAMRAQIRVSTDAPGAPEVDLALVTNGNAEGIRLAGVTTVDGVITNDVRIRLNKSTRQALPYGGERGDAAVLAFAFQIAGRTRLYGNMRILASAIDSDGAPASRPPSYGARISGAPSGGAVLTIADDDVVALTIDGADLLGPLATGAEAAAVRAENAAARIESIKPSIIPFGTATVVSNTTSGTEYDVEIPDGFEPFENGAYVDFIIPADNLGPVSLTIGDATPTLEVFMVVGQQLREGWTARVQRNVGGNKWNLIRQTPNGLSLIAVEDVLGASYQVLSQILGVPIAKPLSDNPNEFFVDFPIWENDAVFEAYIVETNTAPPIINLSSGYRRAVVDAPAGALQAGTIAKFVISFGIDNVYYRGSRPGPKFGDAAGGEDEVDLVAKFVTDAHAAQWQLSSEPVEFPITTAGMSISTEISSGREGAAVYSFSHRLVDLLNGYVYDPENPPTAIPIGARIPGTLWIDDNQSHGGRTIDNFFSQLNESPYWSAGQSRAVILNPGPNDWREGNWNVGQTLPPGIVILEALIVANRAKGIPTIIVLPADPDPTQNDHAKFYTDNPTIKQIHPYDVPAPVDPETEQYPPASQSVGLADMTGSGVLVPFDRRFEQGAALVRMLAVKYRKCVILVDSRKAAFRAVAALQPDAYSKGLLFNPGDDIHYLPYLHDRAGGFPATDLAQDILAGGPIRSVYDGGEWRNYGPTEPVEVFVQSTAPVVRGPYAWWDTSGGDLSLSIEDGQ